MEKINIAELLCNCPKGMELDCTIYEDVILNEIDNSPENEYPIRIKTKNGYSLDLTKHGAYSDTEEAKCVIFPKGKTTWEGFQKPFKDGDVVVADDDKLFQLFLLKYLTHSEDDNSYDGYCYFGWDFQRNELFEKGKWGFNRLATEEEKSKLFDAIKAHGYKWNAETKTLEKLIEPNFKVGDRVRHKVVNKNDVHEINRVYDDSYGFVGFPYTIPMKYQDKYELVPNKFDITNLIPFESKVLVRNADHHNWCPAIFGCKLSAHTLYKYATMTENYYAQCVPYEGNEHLLGTTDECNEYYKNW